MALSYKKYNYFNASLNTNSNLSWPKNIFDPTVNVGHPKIPFLKAWSVRFFKSSLIFGSLIFLEFPEIGDIVVAVEPFGEIEAVKTVSELYSPVNGVVTSINENLEDSPDNINLDSYGKGWILKVKFEDSLESYDLLDNKSYESLIG